MNLLHKAIFNLYPNIEWTLYGNSIDDLVFNDVTIQRPTQAQIDAAIEQVKANEIAEAETKAAAKTAAQAKLAALGLTVEDLQALGL